MQLQPSALDPAHIQDVIDQIHQMITGIYDLVQAVKHPLLFIQMSHGNMGESQNCVHRCPYIMGHISQKYALGPVCVCRALQRVFQKDPLLFLAALLLRLIADDQIRARQMLVLVVDHALFQRVIRGVVPGADDAVFRPVFLVAPDRAELLFQPFVHIFEAAPVCSAQQLQSRAVGPDASAHGIIDEEREVTRQDFLAAC